MKYIILLILFVSSSIYAAPILEWDGVSGAEGYNVYCGETPVGVVVPIDAGIPTSYDLVGSVSTGVQYECWVTAYTAVAESAESNHIQLTPPNPVSTFVIPGQPVNVRILWE